MLLAHPTYTPCRCQCHILGTLACLDGGGGGREGRTQWTLPRRMFLYVCKQSVGVNGGSRLPLPRAKSIGFPPMWSPFEEGPRQKQISIIYAMFFSLSIFHFLHSQNLFSSPSAPLCNTELLPRLTGLGQGSLHIPHYGISSLSSNIMLLAQAMDTSGALPFFVRCDVPLTVLLANCVCTPRRGDK